MVGISWDRSGSVGILVGIGRDHARDRSGSVGITLGIGRDRSGLWSVSVGLYFRITKESNFDDFATQYIAQVIADEQRHARLFQYVSKKTCAAGCTNIAQMSWTTLVQRQPQWSVTEDTVHARRWLLLSVGGKPTPRDICWASVTGSTRVASQVRWTPMQRHGRMNAAQEMWH